MPETSTLKIRNATVEDLQTIQSLLRSSNLPSGSIPKHLSNFLVAEVNGTIAGTIGLEIHEQHGLLRSASILPSYQRRGIGSRLVNMILDYAREKGVKEVVLLTTTAENYFVKKGFSPVDRSTLQGTILSSEEFQSECPSTAICMRKVL